MNSTNLPAQQIQNRIFTIRGLQVMIDRDLAEMYGVETKVLNQAVKRNSERFPESFMFQLTTEEKNELVTNCDHLQKLKYSYRLPFAFGEQGVAMLSSVLRSKTAIKISIQIIQAFIEMKKFILNNVNIFQKIETIEKWQIKYQIENDHKFEQLFKALEDKSLKPKQGIFYDGQVYDAYTFVSDLIRSAKRSIILIDNYVDDTVLTLHTKRKKNVSVTIYTKHINKQLSLDLEKYNKQYPSVEIIEFKNSHDRFIIIDDKTIYHFGASLKDLGKKWFAFSKMDLSALEMLNKLKG